MVSFMKLPDLPLFVLDTETTGFVPKIHRVMEFACIVTKAGKVECEYEQLFEIPDEGEIPQSVQVLTRIRPEDLIDQPILEKCLPEIQKLLPTDAILVGQNIKFDLSMLKGEGWDLSTVPSVDTAMLASLVFPELESYSLGYVSTVLKLDHTPPHRALGDVRATLQLFSACYERLSSLPKKDLDRLKELSLRGPEGYRRLFASIESTGKSRPKWLAIPKPKTIPAAASEVLEPANPGTVRLVEEPLAPEFVSGLISGLKANSWFAVKNLEATLARHPVAPKLTVLYPPEFLLSASATERFLEQDLFQGDELTLAMKLHLYPATVRGDLPLHGEEYSMFTGKLACTAESPEYTKLRAAADKGPTVLSHQHLLSRSDDADSPLPGTTALIVDDASMLEDTATAAFAWTCMLSHLRGAAGGNPLVTKCADLIELWAERVRGGLDLRYLAPSDLETRESTELRGTIESVLDADGISSQVQAILRHVLLILDPKNIPGRITWIEAMMDGSKIIKSVPEDIGALLEKHLYRTVRTTLLVPTDSAESLRSVVSDGVETELVENGRPRDTRLKVRMPVGQTLESVFREPKGKTVVLVSSKRTIEDVYVKHAERLEEGGVTLICQGFNGGQGRMRAEFTAAKAPAILVMTPWMYEGMDLPPDTVDKLVLQTLPFDHPSHPVVGRRASRFRDPFSEYSLPRLKNRLFRLIRTFRKHAAPEATVEILDDRLRTKQYGREVSAYLKQFDAASAAEQPKQLSFL